jgi:excisionase family DNA binding protein
MGGDCVESKIVYSVIELSKMLGISSDTIYTMVREKQISHVRIRRRILFQKSVIETWLQSSVESIAPGCLEIRSDLTVL